MMNVYQAQEGHNDTYIFKHLGLVQRSSEYGVPRGGDFIQFIPDKTGPFPGQRVAAVVANVIWPNLGSPWIIVGDIIGDVRPVDPEALGYYDMCIEPIEVKSEAGESLPEVEGG